MKLYNLYNAVILEENTRLLTEGINDDIAKAMEGKYNVWITYANKDKSISKRYIQIYQRGTSDAGNEMISAYQIGGQGGGTKKGGEPYGWKQFLINSIKNVEPTEMYFTKAISDLPSYNLTTPKGQPIKYNPNGNKNMTKGSIDQIKL